MNSDRLCKEVDGVVVEDGQSTISTTPPPPPIHEFTVVFIAEILPMI